MLLFQCSSVRAGQLGQGGAGKNEVRCIFSFLDICEIGVGAKLGKVRRPKCCVFCVCCGLDPERLLYANPSSSTVYDS